MLAADKITVPSLVVSPMLKAPVPAPEIMPPKVAVWPSAAAILLAPVVRAMVLVMVLVAVFNKVPPPRVTPPVERWLPLAPPEATDKVPPETVVPPVYVLAPVSVTVPAPTLVSTKVLPETMPPRVKLPAPPIELLAAMATVPLTVPALLVSLLIKAPPELMPVPLMVKALRMVLPFTSNTAPDESVTAPVPTAPLVMLDVLPVELTPSFKVPTETAVPPV